MDSFKGTYDRSLVRAARAVTGDVLAVRKEERVLVITNPNADSRQISMAIYDAVIDAGATPVLLIQKEKGQFDFLEYESVKAIESGPDVVISVSKDRLGKDRYGMKHGYKGKRQYDHIFDFLYEERKIRTFWSPGATVDMFARTVPIDYTQMRKDCKRICDVLLEADIVKVTAPGGTDVTIGIRGRKAHKDDGDFRKPGRGGNLPSGEVYISPELGAMNGTIAWDGSIVLNEGEIVIGNPIFADVKGGYITKVRGGSGAKRLEESVKVGESKAIEAGKKGQMKPAKARIYARNAWGIGELGIGLNRKAKITANMLEDEKVYGTCHFAIGSNYDGDHEAMIHLDGLVKSPTITAVRKDGKELPIMSDGKLSWD
jgi:leucyl aminopeptidase (aminopeptidase T)